MVAFASDRDSVAKATCLEGLESATRTQPELVGPTAFSFVSTALDDAEPRVKWEAARVVGNVASRMPEHVNATVASLLRNATHPGTVVRWASAFALSEIAVADADLAETLLPQLERLADEESDPGVKKKYAKALKRAR